jgi:hypothetical protein
MKHITMKYNVEIHQIDIDLMIDEIMRQKTLSSLHLYINRHIVGVQVYFNFIILSTN